MATKSLKGMGPVEKFHVKKHSSEKSDDKKTAFAKFYASKKGK